MQMVAISAAVHTESYVTSAVLVGLLPTYYWPILDLFHNITPRPMFILWPIQFGISEK